MMYKSGAIFWPTLYMYIALHWKPISELRSVTRRMGSHKRYILATRDR